MKTVFANDDTNNINKFTFDVLTSEELALVKGGKEADVYVQP